MDYSNNEILKDIIISHYDEPNNKLKKETNLDNFKVFQNKSASCIDDISVFIKLEDNIIKEIYFDGIGCAISTSSSDIFCDLLLNKTIDEAKIIISEYKKMVMGKEYNKEVLDELIAFKNIHNQPNRINCSIIGVNAIINCLEIKLEE